MVPTRANDSDVRMLKFIIIGLFGIMATAGGLFLNRYLDQQSKLAEPTTEVQAKLLQVKTEMTGIPVVANGLVSGYLVFQISSTIDSSKLPASEFDVGPYILDAAIRASYQSAEIGTQKINGIFIKKLSEIIIEEANLKLGGPVVTAINVEQFNFVPKDEIRGNIKSGSHN
jgi:hypothetical protein